MLVNICMKFHEDILNAFSVMEWTGSNPNFKYLQFQRDITPKIGNPELQFLHSASHFKLQLCVTHKHAMCNNPVKF